MNRHIIQSVNQIGCQDRPRRQVAVQRTPLLMLAITLMLLAVGCSQSEKASFSGNEIQVKRSSEKGSVKLTAQLDRSSAHVAEPVTLSLFAKAPEGITVQFPEIPESLGPFDVVQSTEKLDIPESEGRSWMRTYRLESLSSGDKTIPAISVPFIDRRSGERVHDSVASQPIEVKILSLLEGQADPTQFRDIKGPLELHAETSEESYALAYGIVGGVICLIASAALLLWYRSRRTNTPQEWALVKLSELQESGLLEAGNTHEFYCRLTEIVRFYIERRFNCSAPKQTTTEFLSAMQTESALQDEHRASLQEFLILADMVKFACLLPSDKQARQAIEKAREFVLATAQADIDSEETTEQQVAA